MMHSRSRSALSFPEAFGHPPAPHVAPPTSPHHPSNAAIDAALRHVPLPDGMFNRLHALVAALEDEAAEPLD